MAWTATLASITKDVPNRRVTIVVTIEGGTNLYTLTFVQNFGDVHLNRTEIVNQIREFIAKAQDVEAMIAQLEPLVGQNIPLNL